MSVSSSLRFHDARPEKSDLVCYERTVALSLFGHRLLVAGNVDDPLQTRYKLIVEVMFTQFTQALLRRGIQVIEARQFLGYFSDCLVEKFRVSHGLIACSVESINKTLPPPLISLLASPIAPRHCQGE
jgi:hypothetical protein